MDTSNGHHLFLLGNVSDRRLRERIRRLMIHPGLVDLALESRPACLAHSICHAKCFCTTLYHVVLLQNSRILLRKDLLFSYCILHIWAVQVSTCSDLRTDQGLDVRRGERNAIVSASNIAVGHKYDPADIENMESATFPRVFLQVPVQSAGHMKTWLLFGKMCFASHICSIAIFARAGGGHQIHLPIGSWNT